MASTDSMPIPKKNVAYRVVVPILDADGDLVTGATGLDSEVSKDQGTFADVTAEATEIATASGMYYLDLTATEMNADCVAVIVKTTSSGAKTTPIVMYPEEAGDIRVDATMISGDATAADNAELFYDGTGYNAANSAVGTVAAVTAVSAGGITASSIAADAIGASELAADAVAEIADGVWDELMSGHLTVGSYGQAARGAMGLTGEVNDAGATTTVFIVDGFTEATDNHFNGQVITFTSGANLGESRVIDDYTGATQTITLGEALTDAPADNDDFIISPGSVAIGGTLAQIFRLFITILNTTGQLDAGSLTAGTIDANALATDAVTEIWAKATVEPSAPPAVTASMAEWVAWLGVLSRNKITQTATTQLLRNDADNATIGTSTVSDDGTTAIRGEFA